METITAKAACSRFLHLHSVVQLKLDLEVNNMTNTSKKTSTEFDVQMTSALMRQTNALVPAQNCLRVSLNNLPSHSV